MRTTLFSSTLGDVAVNMAFTNNFAATANPAANNDSSQGYQAGSVWINTSTQAAFLCLSATPGAANWLELGDEGGPVANASASYSAASNAAAFTATAAELSGGSSFVVLDLTGNPAGAANMQLPTVAALFAAIPNAQPGDSYMLRIKNSASSGIWTVTTNTGWTLNGTMTIGATPNWRDFVVTLVSATAATLQDAGGGNVV